jgi:hypothetical protein
MDLNGKPDVRALLDSIGMAMASPDPDQSAMTRRLVLQPQLLEFESSLVVAQAGGTGVGVAIVTIDGSGRA